MLGAIAGDIIGSVFKEQNCKREDFPLFSPNSTFTDDSVLTVAIADVLLHGKGYAETFKEYYFRYPQCSYGQEFTRWVRSEALKPHNSCGNGPAMRVTPIAYAFDTIEDVLAEAKKTAEVTHNHPEGVKGAQATAAAVFLARQDKTSKEDIKKFIEEKCGYNLNNTIKNLQEHYQPSDTCQQTVPQAIMVFLQSENYEDCIRKAVSIGGDSTTIACIAGGIAESFYKKMPEHIITKVKQILDTQLYHIVDRFSMYISNTV